MVKIRISVIAGGLLMLFAKTACSTFYGVGCAGCTLDQAYRDPQALALVRAAVRGNADEVERLVKGGADPNYLEEGSVPMLIWTLCAQNKKGYEALLKAGADPNLGGTGKGFAGSEVIGTAFSRTSRSYIKKGWSATVMAAAIEDPFYLRLALKNGGDPNALRGPEPDDRPLLQAAYYGFFENIKILLASGADINVHDDRYRFYTAPELAIGVYGRFDIAVYLLEQGYNHDLQMLLRSCDRSANEEMKPYREQLIKMLKARGVE